MLGGRGERLDGGETDFAQVGLGLLTREVIGIAQGLDQTLDLLRGGRSGGWLRGRKGLRSPEENQDSDDLHVHALLLTIMPQHGLNLHRRIRAS